MIDRSSVSWAHVAASVAGLAVLVALAATPQLLGSDVKKAFAGLTQAQPEWLWLAALAFVTALLANAWAWRSTIHTCGGEIGRVAAAATRPISPPQA